MAADVMAVSERMVPLPTYEDDQAALRFGKAGWKIRMAGGDGFGCWENHPLGLRLIESRAIEDDGGIWSHVSVSQRDHRMPSWETVRDVMWLVWPHRYGIIVVAPKSQHVNIAEVAHVWVRLDRPAVPDFTRGMGSI